MDLRSRECPRPQTPLSHTLCSPSAPLPALPTRPGPSPLPQSLPGCSCSSEGKEAPTPEPRGSRGAGKGGGTGGCVPPSSAADTKSKIESSLLRRPGVLGCLLHPASDDSPASCTGAEPEQPGTRSTRWLQLGAQSMKWARWGGAGLSEVPLGLHLRSDRFGLLGEARFIHSTSNCVSTIVRGTAGHRRHLRQPGGSFCHPGECISPLTKNRSPQSFETKKSLFTINIMNVLPAIELYIFK